MSVLAMQCLDRRIPAMEDLQREVHAWQDDRNQTTKGVDRQFSTHDDAHEVAAGTDPLDENSFPTHLPVLTATGAWLLAAALGVLGWLATRRRTPQL